MWDAADAAIIYIKFIDTRDYLNQWYIKITPLYWSLSSFSVPGVPCRYLYDREPSWLCLKIRSLFFTKFPARMESVLVKIKESCYPGCNAFRKKDTFLTPQDSYFCLHYGSLQHCKNISSEILYVLYFVFAIIGFGYLNPTETHSLNFTGDYCIYCRCFVISFFPIPAVKLSVCVLI